MTCFMASRMSPTWTRSYSRACGPMARVISRVVLMGCLMGVFEHFQALPVAMRLFALTGFLGGLTTFSTFSAEANTLLLRQQYFWFGVHVLSHLVGTLSLTLLGIFLARGLLRH